MRLFLHKHTTNWGVPAPIVLGGSGPKLSWGPSSLPGPLLGPPPASSKTLKNRLESLDQDGPAQPRVWGGVQKAPIGFGYRLEMILDTAPAGAV